MNPRVRTFLKEHCSSPTYDHRSFPIQNQEKWIAYQHDVLILLGLYDKIYSPHYTAEFPFAEANPQSGELQYYKKQAISVTREEFALIQPYSPIAYNE